MDGFLVSKKVKTRTRTVFANAWSAVKTVRRYKNFLLEGLLEPVNFTV